jgi:hypothetical protein
MSFDGGPNPAAGGPHPAAGGPNPAAAGSHPAAGDPHPTAGGRHPVDGGPSPAAMGEGGVAVEPPALPASVLEMAAMAPTASAVDSSGAPAGELRGIFTPELLGRCI